MSAPVILALVANRLLITAAYDNEFFIQLAITMQYLQDLNNFEG